MFLVSARLCGGRSINGVTFICLYNSGLYWKLHLCLFKPFLFLKCMRQLLHSFLTLSDSSGVSESVSEEEKSELCGVRVKLGEERGEVGESIREDVLDAGVILLILLGLSGVRNVVRGGGHDRGREVLGGGAGGG